MCLSKKWLGFFGNKWTFIFLSWCAFLRVRKLVNVLLYEAFMKPLCLFGEFYFVEFIHSFMRRVVLRFSTFLFVQKMAGCFFVKKRIPSFFMYSFDSANWQNGLNLRPLSTFEILWNSFVHCLAFFVLNEKYNIWGFFCKKDLGSTIFFFLRAFIHKMLSISMNVQFSDVDIS